MQKATTTTTTATSTTRLGTDLLSLQGLALAVELNNIQANRLDQNSSLRLLCKLKLVKQHRQHRSSLESLKMDIVNSVTQNSNNKNVTMENQPPIYSSNSLQQLHQSQQQHHQPDSVGLSGHQQQSASAVAMSGEVAPKPPSETTKSQVPEYLRRIGMDPKKYWPKKYRFTREKTPGQYNPLTIVQRNFYENNGYLVLDECSSSRLIEAIKADRSCLAASEPLVEKLVARSGNLLQYVRCFCDERAMLMTHTLVDNFRPSSVGGSSEPQRQHLLRDWVYLPFRPIDKVVCAITALEPLENVILVVPGTHKVGQCMTITSSKLDGAGQVASSSSYEAAATRGQLNKQLFECSPENLSSLVERSQKGLKYVDLKRGQTLFYHPGLVHGFSNDLVNLDKSQLATIAYYAAADCEYIEMRTEDDGEANQRLLPVGLAHFGDKDPSDYNSWLNRPRLLQNLKASL